MRGLIIAAGLGSRLSEEGECKPLTPLFGKPLIEHVMDRAFAAGIADFTVVTGHKGAFLEAHLERQDVIKKYAIEAVRTPDWTLKNGLSVLTGMRHIADECVLFMSDHLFDPANCQRLLQEKTSKAMLTLAIDRRLDNALVDLEDVTRVATTQDGRIERIGKVLPNYDAFDTGMFHLRRDVAATLEMLAQDKADFSLTDAVGYLAANDLAYTVDVENGWWMDIDTPHDLKRVKQMGPSVGLPLTFQS